MTRLIALAAICLAFASPAHSENDDKHTTYGLGTMECREATKLFPKGDGDLAFSLYIGGFLSGVNWVYKSSVAEGEPLQNIVRMAKITCIAHKSWTIEKVILTLLDRIAERDTKDVKAAEKLLEKF